MFARVARYQIPEESLDDAVEAFREAVEGLRQLQGNSGGYLLVDRDNCTALTVTFWENRAALESSEVQASRLRLQAVRRQRSSSRETAAAGEPLARVRGPGVDFDARCSPAAERSPQKKVRPGRICGQSAGADPVFGLDTEGPHPISRDGDGIQLTDG